MQDKPNILIIQTDQHAANTIGCYGDKNAKTENLDRLAAGGVRFTKCASNNPVCASFRGTMQTGLYSHTHGTIHNLVPLDTRLPTMATILNSAGYITGYAGKWHLSRRSRARSLEFRNVPPDHRGGWQDWYGFERSFGHYSIFHHSGGDIVGFSKGWEPEWLSNIAIDFIITNQDRPWAFYVAPSAPHPPSQCPEQFLELYDQDSIVPPVPGIVPDEILPVYQEILRRYYGQVSAIDREVGRLVECLAGTGLLENTIIVYTSDHGDRLGHHFSRLGSRIGALRGKGGPFHSEFHIPLIVHWPARIRCGRACDVLLDSVDLLPTILGLAGIPLLGYFQGNCMAEWCIRNRGPQKPVVYLEHGMARGAWRGVWDGRFVYSPSLQLMYDHSIDPHEFNNLYAASKYEDERVRLHSELYLIAESTRDQMAHRLRQQGT